jgi:hypothetical protein
LVEFGEIGDQVGRQCKIQGSSPRDRFCRYRKTLTKRAGAVRLR